MKVKHLMYENTYGSVEDFINNVIKTNCSNNFKAIANGEAKPLWRGTRLAANSTPVITRDSSDNVLGFDWIIQAPPVHRDSITNSNVLADIISTSPKWHDFPSRNKSIFCSHDKDWTSSFGPPHLVIPFDSVKSYAVAKSDMNITNIDGLNISMIIFASAVSHIKSTLHHLLRTKTPLDKSVHILFSRLKSDYFTNQKPIKIRLDVVPDVESDINTIEEFLMKNPLDLTTSESLVREYKRISDAVAHYKSIVAHSNLKQLFLKQITPENMGCALYSDLSSIPDDIESEEIWFEGSYVLVLAHRNLFLDHMQDMIREFKI